MVFGSHLAPMVAPRRTPIATGAAIPTGSKANRVWLAKGNAKLHANIKEGDSEALAEGLRHRRLRPVYLLWKNLRFEDHPSNPTYQANQGQS